MSCGEHPLPLPRWSNWGSYTLVTQQLRVQQRTQGAHESDKEWGLALLTLCFNEVKFRTPLTACLHVRNLVRARYCPRWTHGTDTALA